VNTKGVLASPLTVLQTRAPARRETVPLRLPADWRGDVNYSARTKDGRVNFDALPANDAREYCAVLLLRAADPLARAGAPPAELRALLDAELPQARRDIIYSCITLHYITLHYITLHYITLHYIALHCITLHYIALHCIALHYIALHCIAFTYTFTSACLEAAEEAVAAAAAVARVFWSRTTVPIIDIDVEI